MAQVQNPIKGLIFSYGNEASANFLVVLCELKVIGYQVKMLEHNLIRHVISPVVVRKEGINHFYYNITSKIPLSFILKRRKISRDAFIKLLLQITSAINDSSGYLLGISNFIIDPDYIYVDPETLEPSLVYVPASIGQNDCEAIRSFISDFLLAHINVDGFDRGNMVQKILSAVNSDIFNTKAFVALMNDLMYGQEQNEGAGKPEETIQPAKSIQSSRIRQENVSTAENYIKDKKEEKKAEEENEKTNGNKVLLITIGAVLLQFVMGGIIYLNLGFLKSIGDNQTTTFSAVAMIVLAVDVLLFKKITDAKMICIGSRPPDSVIEKDKCAADQKRSPAVSQPVRIQGNIPVSADISDRQAKKGIPSMQTQKEMYEMQTQKDFLADGAQRAACKTELLVSNKKGNRLLRSTGKHNGDEDIIIDKDDFIIGRLAGHVDHILRNNAVGKLHAEIICRNGVCYVKDLNTVNGTYINNIRIDSNKEVELKESDRLQLANSEFVLTYS